MTLTDEELDREWQPSGRRPQSTIARSFSQELMDIFRIENSVSDLDAEVHQKKQKVDRTTKELASLEARLREMEERLKRSQGGPPQAQHARTPLPQLQRQPQQQQAAGSATNDEQLQVDKTRSSRPGTARATQPAPSSGDMPPTPGASEDGDGE